METDRNSQSLVCLLLGAPIMADRLSGRAMQSGWVRFFKGGPEGMELKRFDDAMMDSSTGLTRAALTGERKQSVGDAEQMLLFLVAKFLREHGYIREANYIDIVAGWHEAADGRGLTELQRYKRNYAMLNMILDEWMPRHREIPDLSTIGINRYSTT